MKKQLLLPIVLVSIFLGSCQTANESDYNNVAQDICQCSSGYTSTISENYKKTIIDAAKNNKGLDEVMKEMMQTEDSTVANLMIVDALQAAGLGIKLDSCINSLDSKYAYLKTKENEKEVQEKMMNALMQQKDCEFLAAFMKLALNTKQ